LWFQPVPKWKSERASGGGKRRRGGRGSNGWSNLHLGGRLVEEIAVLDAFDAVRHGVVDRFDCVGVRRDLVWGQLILSSKKPSRIDRRRFESPE